MLVVNYKPSIDSLPPTTAIMVGPIEIEREPDIWTKPAKIKDDRSLWERTFKLNLYKIYKTENRGYRFLGSIKTCKVVLKFDGDYEMNRKIEKVETMECIFYGVIPIDEKSNGTLCITDCFEYTGA